MVANRYRLTTVSPDGIPHSEVLEIRPVVTPVGEYLKIDYITNSKVTFVRNINLVTVELIQP